MTSLAEPLARAMASRGATFYSPVPEQGTDVDAILAALRADPATLAALAEALHADCVFEWNRRWATGARHITQHGVDAHDAAVARLADALFGAAMTAALDAIRARHVERMGQTCLAEWHVPLVRLGVALRHGAVRLAPSTGPRPWWRRHKRCWPPMGPSTRMQ